MKMIAKDALDAIVARIEAINEHLSGDDSPLANPWEEIKEQLQNELSAYWHTVYLVTIKQIISAFVSSLGEQSFAELSAVLRSAEKSAMETTLLNRLLLRGKKERIRFAPFDFSHFCYRVMDFTVYAHIIERTGLHSCLVMAYSVAAPSGERGEVNTADIDQRGEGLMTLSPEEFEVARAASWPE